MSLALNHHRPVSRIRAVGLHLILSTAVALIASMLVFLAWYPPPFAVIAGGSQLFVLLVVVDVVLGPALTFVVVSPGKLRRALALDLSFIVTLQCAAFGYGIYTMALARPIALVHEVDLFRLVSAADVDQSMLAKVEPQFRALSWHGPKLIAAIKPTQLGEQLRAIELGFAGIHLAALPEYWRDYATRSDQVWASARPGSLLSGRFPEALLQIAKAAAVSNLNPDEVRFIPVVSRQSNWVALMAQPGARIIGYLPFDGQF